MTIPDDPTDLERRLRATRPDLPRRGDPLTEAEERMLAGIMAGSAPTARRRRAALPSRLGLAAAIVLVALALAVTGIVTLRPQRAFAATPPLLDTRPLTDTPATVLRQAANALPPTRQVPRSRTFHTWSLASEPEEDGTLTSFVQPFIVTARMSDDNTTTTMTWVAGPPLPADAPRALPENGPVPDYPASEFPVMFADPPDNPNAYAAYLTERAFLPENATTGDYLWGVQMLLNERQLAADQETALLQFLATLPDLTVDGAVTDRLGRPGVALGTTSRAPEEYRDTLIVSPDGHGILSSETTYTGKDRSDIQAPSVILYHAWER